MTPTNPFSHPSRFLLYAAFALCAAALALVGSAASDPDISPYFSGEWRSRTAGVAQAVSSGNPCPEPDEVCVEWCEFAADGEATPTGELCCKPKSSFDPHDPTCAHPVTF